MLSCIPLLYLGSVSQPLVTITSTQEKRCKGEMIHFSSHFSGLSLWLANPAVVGQRWSHIMAGSIGAKQREKQLGTRRFSPGSTSRHPLFPTRPYFPMLSLWVCQRINPLTRLEPRWPSHFPKASRVATETQHMSLQRPSQIQAVTGTGVYDGTCL